MSVTICKQIRYTIHESNDQPRTKLNKEANSRSFLDRHAHDVITVHAHAHTFKQSGDLFHVHHRRLFKHCRSHEHIRSVFGPSEAAPTGPPYETLGTTTKPEENGFSLANTVFPSAARAAPDEFFSINVVTLSRKHPSAQPLVCPTSLPCALHHCL